MESRIDRSVLLFTLALAFLTPLVFGLLPSLQASRPDLRDALAEAGRGTAAPTRASVRGLLVAVEVAVALLLLVGAGLLIRSFANVLSVDPGFEPRGAVTASMAVPGTKYETAERAAQFYATLLERLRVLPGVSAAGAVNQLPLAGTDRTSGAFAFVGNVGSRCGRRYLVPRLCRTPRTIASPRRDIWKPSARGSCRDACWTSTTGPGQPEVAVVNQAFVRRYLPGTNPIGVRFKYAGMDPVNPVFTIVGVTADVRQASLVRASVPEVYVCAYQAPTRAKYTMTTVVRAASPTQAATLPNAVRDAIRRTEPDVAVEMSTLDQVTLEVRRRPALHADPARDLRRDGPAARGNGRLQRAVADGGETDAGNRYPDGARRRASTRRASDARLSPHASCRRHRRRRGRRDLRRAIPCRRCSSASAPSTRSPLPRPRSSSLPSRCLLATFPRDGRRASIRCWR